MCSGWRGQVHQCCYSPALACQCNMTAACAMSNTRSAAHNARGDMSDTPLRSMCSAVHAASGNRSETLFCHRRDSMHSVLHPESDDGIEHGNSTCTRVRPHACSTTLTHVTSIRHVTSIHHVYVRLNGSTDINCTQEHMHPQECPASKCVPKTATGREGSPGCTQ